MPDLTIIQQFRDALIQRGIVPPDDLRADGELHRCDAEGKGGKNDAAYVLHLNGIAAGGFINWRDGQDWQHWRADMERTLSSAEETAYRAKIEATRQAREAEEAKRQADAAQKAAQLWAEAAPCTSHPYLTRKGIAANGAKIYRDSLVLPIRDTGTLCSLQFIGTDGGKRYLSGGRIRGGYFGIGKPDGVLCIAEGFATGASIHEATGHAVAVAFDAGNLHAVATALRAKFPDLRLILCADDDYRTEGNPGITKATAAAQAVGGWLAVPDFGDHRPEGATDFNDLHQAQGLAAVARCMAAALEEAAVAPDDHGPVVISIADLLYREFPPRENVLAPWLPGQGLVMIYAPRGVGKTWFSLWIAVTTAAGIAMCRGWHAPAPRGVLYLDGEMPAPVLQERLAAIVSAIDGDIVAPFYILTPDLQPAGMPDLATAEGQAAIESRLTDDIKLIVVDNLSTLARKVKENEGDTWLLIQEWALRQRARGRSVLFVHHAGKGGQQRGTSRREDVLDTVIALRRPSENNPADGAKFEVHFEKARGIYGDDVNPFEAHLTEVDGKLMWTVRDLDDTTFDRVVALLKEGLNQTDIANKLEVSKSTVSRYAARARQEGLIPNDTPPDKPSPKKGKPVAAGAADD